MRIDYRWIPFVAFLSACTMGPDFQRPAMQTPAQWPEAPATTDARRSVAVPEPLDPLRWNSFREPLLTERVPRAIGSNLALKGAPARQPAAPGPVRRGRTGHHPSVK